VYVPSATSTGTMLGTALHKIARGLEKADFHKITLKLETLLLHVEKLVEETNLPKLTGQAGQMLAEFHETAQKIRALVESPEIQTITAEGAKRVQETRPLIAELSQASKQIKIVSDQFPDTFARLERTVQRIDRLVSHNSQDMEEMVENFRMVSENLRELTDNAKQYPAQVLFGDPPPRGEARTR
jgi:phospholipid/cholesterol/gamma-HCH transport system substrate-binding protein